MRPRSVEHGRELFSNGAHIRLVFQPCADCHHTMHTRPDGAVDILRARVIKVGKVEVAVAVGYLGA